MAELPTVEEIFANKDIKSSFQEAWNDSFTTPAHCCEQGGFIYADPHNLKKLAIKRVPKGISDNQRSPKGANMAIDLNNPGFDSPWILVANFHTHPLAEDVGGNQWPSVADQVNAYYRKIPGIVISRRGIIKYGPGQREDQANPSGYPPQATGDPQVIPARLVENSRPPKKAPNQNDP